MRLLQFRHSLCGWSGVQMNWFQLEVRINFVDDMPDVDRGWFRPKRAVFRRVPFGSGDGRGRYEVAHRDGSRYPGHHELLPWTPVHGGWSVPLRLHAPTFCEVRGRKSPERHRSRLAVVSAANSLGESPNSAQIRCQASNHVRLPTAPVNLTAAREQHPGWSALGTYHVRDRLPHEALDDQRCRALYRSRRSDVSAAADVAVIRIQTTYFYVVSADYELRLESVNKPGPSLPHETGFAGTGSHVRNDHPRDRLLDYLRLLHRCSSEHAGHVDQQGRHVEGCSPVQSASSEHNTTTPSKAGTNTVTATNNADPTKSGFHGGDGHGCFRHIV